jgi:hypothetical protein
MHFLAVSHRPLFKGALNIAPADIGLNKAKVESLSCIACFLCDFLDSPSSKHYRRASWNYGGSNA